MRAKAIAIAAVCVAAVAAIAIGAWVVLSDDDSSDAAASGATTSADGSRTMTIRVLASVTKATPVDIPPRNVQNKGDRVFVESQLRNAVPQFGQPKGSIVGIDYSTITFLSSTQRLVSVQITLPGGGLRLRGTLDVSDPNALVKIPVISGTRDFAGATGYSEARSAGGQQTLNIYRLRLP
jgi:hypothetical protein